MTLVFRYFIRYYLIARFTFHRLTRTGCFGRGQAVPFAPGPRYASGPGISAAPFRHHVKQFHESSCSVASVVSVVNVLRERYHGPGIKPVTQKEILNRVREAHWRERMGPDGYQGRRGLPLDILYRVVRASLKDYDIPGCRVELIRASGGEKRREVRRQLISSLRDFQDRDACLIIAHFDQGSFVKELNIPHISPVGAFDSRTGQVPMLDVDPDQPRPYRLPFHRFYKGISTQYGGIFRPFDYGRGGVVVIRLDTPAPTL